MERQELIRAAASATTAPAAPKHPAPPGSSANNKSPRRQPLFYAHCASAQQTLLHMTIAKGTNTNTNLLYWCSLGEHTLPAKNNTSPRFFNIYRIAFCKISFCMALKHFQSAIRKICKDCL